MAQVTVPPRPARTRAGRQPDDPLVHRAGPSHSYPGPERADQVVLRAGVLGPMLALGGAATGLILLDDSWLQLLIAGALGLIFTQFAFLGHEASHRQILASGPSNDRIGRVLATLFVGISYDWWMNKHTRHHANPNKIGKDPDIEIDTISFLEEDAASRRGLMAWFTRRQGYLFFPLLLLEGLNLHIRSISALFGPRRVEGRWLELTLLGARFAVYLAVLFWLLPLGMAFAFLGVQLAVFGLYMGSSFAPNHVGMPIVAGGREARLLEQAGAYGAQRLRRLVGDAVDGRPQLPDRAPPLPEHGPAAPGQDPPAGDGALSLARRAVRRDLPAAGLGHRDRVT